MEIFNITIKMLDKKWGGGIIKDTNTIKGIFYEKINENNVKPYA